MANTKKRNAPRYIHNDPGQIRLFMAKVATEMYKGTLKESRGKAVIYALNAIQASLSAESQQRQIGGPAVQIIIGDTPGSGKSVEIKNITPQPKELAAGEAEDD